MTRGKLYAVGLGPGSSDLLTPKARAALIESQVIAGYRTYLELITPFLEGKEVLASGMMHEVDRAKAAVEAATDGKVVSVVCSGDPGVYGMAGLIYEVLRERGWHREEGIEVEVVPGVAAINAAAALLGAPLMHDFAAISLSDLLTPWEVIARRIELAAEGDFVIGLYNPRSNRRVLELTDACAIIGRFRAPQTPVGIVRCAYREEQSVSLTDLRHLPEKEVDMLSIVVVGNSCTLAFEGLMVTPRGYGAKYDLSSGQGVK
jgi:cobalt-factor III methyltransferase